VFRGICERIRAAARRWPGPALTRCSCFARRGPALVTVTTESAPGPKATADAALPSSTVRISRPLVAWQICVPSCAAAMRYRPSALRGDVIYLPGLHVRRQERPEPDGTSMLTGFLPAASKDALMRMSEEVRSWRIHLRIGTETARSRRVDQPHRQWMDDLPRLGVQDHAEAHQHLPGALGAADLQTAAAIQASPQMVDRADRKAAAHVRPLGLDARTPTRLWMRRAE
jgi:hypothetical protein